MMMLLESYRRQGPSQTEGHVLKPKVSNIPEAAQRALDEAKARRAEIDRAVAAMPTEVDGRKSGPEPSRYGDWEKDGIASDF